MLIYYHVLVNDNSLLKSKERDWDSGDLNTLHEHNEEFHLCSGENLCPESSNDCFKSEICTVRCVGWSCSVQSPSKIRYDTVHK